MKKHALLSIISFFFQILIGINPGQAADKAIDWSVCTQPNRNSNDYQAALGKQIENYTSSAVKQFPSVHISLALNKYYGNIVQQRRDFVTTSYIPVGPSRSESACALSSADYRRLLIVRDASYYVLCRAEVAAGTSKAARLKNDLKSLTYAGVYDFLKTVGVDLRAKPDEPTTPPGGYAGCERGRSDGFKDPIPSPNQVKDFTTRLIVSDSEKRKLGDPTQQ